MSSESMSYDVQWLLSRINKKERVKYLFFWGHTPAKDGSVTKACFSQWWTRPFEVEGIRYATAEHWMMAKKAALFQDKAMLQQILLAKSPAEAKRLGRMVKGFDGATWDAVCFEFVCEGNFHKFSQHPALGDFLLSTRSRILVEASPVDKIWGIGLAQDDERAENPRLWNGQNLLGFALMVVRDRLAG